MSDLGHLLPDDEWAAVVADAGRHAQRIEVQRAAVARAALEGELVEGDDGKPRRFTTGLGVNLAGTVVAARHGGRRQPPTFGVLHSAETPLLPGYAAAIARMFATTTLEKSCHYMTDPAETWGVLDDLLVAWHVGNGNPNSIGLEQAGYARFTRAEWLVPEGLAQMQRNAEVMRAARDRFGIRLGWMTADELRRAHRREIVGGWATHDQCAKVLGGTTHTDPMPNFPLDVQMQLAADTPTTGDAVPTFQTINVPVGQPTPIAVPPANDGGAKWGPGWVTFLPDRMGQPGGAFRGRIMVKNKGDGWRNAFGRDPFVDLEPGKSVTIPLATGDRGLVVSETNCPLSVCVEFGDR